MKKAFLLCKPYILSHKVAMSLYILLSFLLIFQSLATPYISGNFIDVLILGGDKSIVFAYCGLFESTPPSLYSGYGKKARSVVLLQDNRLISTLLSKKF